MFPFLTEKYFLDHLHIKAINCLKVYLGSFSCISKTEKCINLISILCKFLLALIVDTIDRENSFSPNFCKAGIKQNWQKAFIKTLTEIAYSNMLAISQKQNCS